MKFEPPINPSYAATVVRLANIVPLDNCANVVGTTIFGYQAIVGKDSKIGDIGIVFPAESQLSDDFCRENNLYRHKEKNKNQDKAGYIEDSRRVRAVKFRGHTSSCFFLSLESLAYLGIDLSDLKEGDTFDKIGEAVICKKYVVREPRGQGARLQQAKKSRVDSKHLPEHVDTLQWLKNFMDVDPDAVVSVTAKIHGTSIRAGHTYVTRRLTLRDRLAKFLGAKVQETEHAYVFGSRKVIKDPNSDSQRHYYDAGDGMDIWNTEGKKLEGLLPKNCVVYGELVGYTPTGAAIQEGYTYGFGDKTCGLYIYRVTFVNEDGDQHDLSYDQLRQFCRERGLNNVVELWRGKARDFKYEDWIDKRYKDMGFTQCLPLSDPGTVDEGVCLRVEGVIPRMFKVKSPLFYEWETSQLDKGKEDLESVQSDVLP